jgi:hypothetical protein
MEPDYKTFAKWCLKESWDGCGLDGGEVQDKAVSLGIIKQVPYDPDKHGPNNWDAEPGDPWYVLVEE